MNCIFEQLLFYSRLWSCIWFWISQLHWLHCFSSFSLIVSTICFFSGSPVLKGNNKNPMILLFFRCYSFSFLVFDHSTFHILWLGLHFRMNKKITCMLISLCKHNIKQGKNVDIFYFARLLVSCSQRIALSLVLTMSILVAEWMVSLKHAILVCPLVSGKISKGLTS